MGVHSPEPSYGAPNAIELSESRCGDLVLGVPFELVLSTPARSAFQEENRHVICAAWECGRQWTVLCWTRASPRWSQLGDLGSRVSLGMRVRGS